MEKLISPVDVNKSVYYEITPARAAMLDTIAWTEGTDRSAEGRSGYDVLYGNGRFRSYVTHPRIIINAGGWTSSAAGRYQILDKTWDWMQKTLQSKGLKPFPSFAPEYQDQAALYLIDAKRQALGHIDRGNLESALQILSWEWASLPPARYGQHVFSVPECQSLYKGFLKKWA